AGEGDDRADRQVEIARGQAEHHGAGDDADRHHRLQQAEHVALGQEVRNGQRHHGEGDGEADDEALLSEQDSLQGTGHQETFLIASAAERSGSAAARMVRSLKSARSKVAAMLPSHMTAMRSEMPITSGSSLDTTTMASPLSAKE